MDDLVRYGPWLLSSIALLLAWSASRAASAGRIRGEPAGASTDAPRAPSPAGRAAASPDPVVTATSGLLPAPPASRPTALEERLGALEERLHTLSEAVAFAARPEPDDVAPMRPPAATTAEPLPAPRAGWRMFP